MISQFRGLVLNESPWGEHDKLLTVLTAEVGKLPVLLKGGSSLKNKDSGACLPFSYTEFVTADRGGRPWIREANCIEGYINLRSDLENTALAMYFCDIANEVCTEGGDESEMLQLILNSLYALDRGLKPRELVKAAFELRTAVISGFTPDLVKCVDCGASESEAMYLDVMDGVIHCAECRKKRNLSAPREGHTALLYTLDKQMLDAMRFVSYCEAKKLLSFVLPNDLHAVFGKYCEGYLLNHIDRGFKSLEFYNLLSL